jgi:structure-specific recognition protein 1
MKSHTGRFRIASNGIGWKGTAGDPIVLSPDDLRKFLWMRAARGYQLRVSLKDNQILKFDGFRSDVCNKKKQTLISCTNFMVLLTFFFIIGY